LPATRPATIGTRSATSGTVRARLFEPYTGELFESFVAEQLAFLDKNLA